MRFPLWLAFLLSYLQRKIPLLYISHKELKSGDCQKHRHSSKMGCERCGECNTTRKQKYHQLLLLVLTAGANLGDILHSFHQWFSLLPAFYGLSSQSDQIQPAG